MPLRRHVALQDLSRDHHRALLLARGLRWDVPRHLRSDLPKTSVERAAHVRSVFDAELAPHFLAEESVLFPAVAGKDGGIDGLCAEATNEHDALRALVAVLGETNLGPIVIEHTLDRFGRLLEDHVRKEERSLYPRIQEVLGEVALSSLGSTLHAARA